MKKIGLTVLGLLVFAFFGWVEAEEAWTPLATDPEATETVIVHVDDGAVVKTTPKNHHPSFAELPVLDPLLVSAAKAAGSEMVRVIIHLDYMPHAPLADQVRNDHAAEMAALKAQVDAINLPYAEARIATAPKDSDNYGSMFDILPADRAEMKALNERYEALSTTMRREFKQVLEAAIEPYRESVLASLADLGAQVEFTTLSGNGIIALVPGDVLADVAAIPKVGRVAADELTHSDLNIADDATLVTSTMTGGGLWDNGYHGDIWDPAIIDSGTDRTHPFMDDQTGRENHWSWYLVAGAGHPDFDPDEVSHYEDDLQGHGSHVAGIVGSLGSGTYPDILGMSYGVEKFVTLKAAWRNTSSGGASMYASDRMHLTDRALYRVEELRPDYGTNVFQDDVDGFNLSYSSSTSSDDTDSSRFVDSVVADTLPNTPWTLSAGNTGPSNTIFNSPANSYNAITVAATDDVDTVTRADDVLAGYSSRGATASGRRKPDLAAPGTDIRSANQHWEVQQDWVEKDGTSMAAPTVLGVAMALMDAGLTHELSIKATLLNTAQKNEAGYDFESDSDGWSPGMGWGYMNAWAAYYHRFDYRAATLAPRNQPGDYRLYKGTMRDEGAGGEGRDRATMVWHRHATYNPTDYPTTYYNLSDLDLVLYEESNGSFIDGDSTVLDNVQQVRIGAGSGTTDVVLKPMAWSTSFPHGGPTESFSLATEEGFTEVSLPVRVDTPPSGSWPMVADAGVVRAYRVYLRNNGDVALHNITFDLRTLPAGWTLVSGPDAQNVGSAASGGGATAWATWYLRTPVTPDTYEIWFDVSQSSYGLFWGGEGWYFGTIVVDSQIIFIDGFESGSDSAWDNATP